MQSGKFICDSCLEEFPTQIQLKIHYLSYHHGNLHTCTVCNSVFTDLNVYKRHCFGHFDEIKYECPDCEKPHINPDDLKRHFMLRDQGTTHECRTCLQKFCLKKDLKNHLLTHKKSKKCETCGKAFKKLVQLKLHQLIHTAAIPHSCELPAVEPSSLDSSYKCEICLITLIEKSDLKAYPVIQSGIVQLVCRKCQIRISSKDSENENCVMIFKKRLISKSLESQKNNPGKSDQKTENVVQNICTKKYPKHVNLSNLSSKLKKLSLRRVNPIPIRACKSCNGFLSLGYGILHMLIHSERKKDCTFCSIDYQASCEIDLKLNRNQQIIKASINECRLCDQGYKKLRIVEQRYTASKQSVTRKNTFKSLKQKEVTSSTKEQFYSCQNCKKYFKTKDRRLKHYFTHKGIPYVCSFCKNSIVHKKKLKIKLK